MTSLILILYMSIGKFNVDTRNYNLDVIDIKTNIQDKPSIKAN